jgi:hypothetical protein
VSNFRFEQLLEASGLPEGERRDLSNIFSVLPPGRRVDVIEQWETSVLPKLLEAKALLEEQRNEILAQSVRQLREIRDQFAALRREAQAAADARAAELAQGSAAFDAARAAKAQSAQMAKLRAMAGAPAEAEKASPAATPAPQADPLLAVGETPASADPLASLG